MIRTSKITKGSILVSINIILFLLCKIINITDLTLLTFSSLIICLSIIKFGTKYSFLILISSTITSITFGLIEYSLIYVIFFGSYPILKFYIENFNTVVIEIFLKLTYFNILFLLIFFTYLKLFFPIKITFIIVLLSCIISSFLFLIYDLMLTKIINYIYNNNFMKNL